jgi:hypothetical protein
MGEYGCATLFPSSFSQGDHRAEPPQVAKNMPLFPFPSKEKESRVRSSSQPHMWREEPMLWDDRHFIVGMISRFLHPLDGTSVCSRCQNLKSMSLFLRFISDVLAWQSPCCEIFVIIITSSPIIILLYNISYIIVHLFHLVSMTLCVSNPHSTLLLHTNPQLQRLRFPITEVSPLYLPSVHHPLQLGSLNKSPSPSDQRCSAMNLPQDPRDASSNFRFLALIFFRMYQCTLRSQ